MNEMISYCGLVCSQCPIFIATRETDKTKKEKMIYEIVDLCQKIYGLSYTYEDITDCDGCRSESGRLFSGCKNCEIKKCAADKNIDNCALCEDYACEKLLEIFKIEPNAKIILEGIRNNIAN